MVDYAGAFFDADNHYYEAADAFTRHVPKKMHSRCVQTCTINGKVRHLVAGKVDKQIGNPSFNPISRPGVLHKFFRGNPEGLSMLELIRSELEPLPPEYMDRDARIAKMDEQRLEAAWLFPTLGVLYEEPLSHDTQACTALFRGFNRWLDEDWGLNFQDRLFAAPYFPLGDVDWACEEIDWAVKQGARLICVRPAAVRCADGKSRSCTHPMFDPFWARVNEAGITVIAHGANSGYTTHGYGTGTLLEALGEQPSVASQKTERAANDWLLDLMYGKLFERFPRVRVGSVESGSGYLPYLLKQLENARQRCAGYFGEDPIALFRKHVWINPFWEDEVADVVEWVGADRVIIGSDWPHMEGTTTPRDIIEECSMVDDGALDKILYGNTKELTEPLAA